MKALPAILSHIHCIGFDMDHTIVRYNLPNLYKLVFNCLSTYMVDHENFYSEYKNIDLKPEFCAKGLVLDIVKGNCIKLDENKQVAKAVHGFKPMSEEEIKQTYPDPIVEYNGHKTERYFTAISYFEATVCSLFLHAVELEEKYSKKPDYGKIVQGLARGFEHSFGKFPEGPFFSEMVANLHLYVYKASPDFIKWLQALRAKGTKIALITNSFAEYTHLLMHYCYGEKFHELFDVVIVQAIKPAFFKHKEPFLEFETYFPDVDSAKFVQDLQLHRKPLPIFSKGNVFHLIESLERVYLAEHPEDDVYESNKLKWCYVGDHMIGDVMVPKVELAWTTIAIVEEIEHLYHSVVTPEKGQHWGSFFYHDKNESEKFHTYFAKLLRESADYCCISVEDLVHIEDHQMDTHSLSPCVVIQPKTSELSN